MPLYIVRWANLSASLLRADDEGHLQRLLDEIGDPGAAIWEEYDGPVWIEFEPKRRETDEGDFEIVDDFDAETSPWDILRPKVAATDTCMEMYWAMLERLFPHLEVVLRETAGSDIPPKQAKAIISRALEREDWHADASVERWDRYAGGDSIMGAAGLSVLPKHIASAILAGLEHAREAGRDVDDEIMAIAAQQRDDLTWRDAQRERLEEERQRARADLDSESDDLVE